ncbi:aminotransferase class IV [Poriferisphaera sp. WC338]|uniref:aminotransferase class IV n=1 Tax=Poriferisphaera sp. WC338 TaxID=3425129 RepID=UPI003D8148D6
MSQDSICYLSGKYLPKSQATLPVEERGLLFAEGVYEVVRTYAGQLYEMQPHLDRLQRSLNKTGMTAPKDLDQLTAISEKLVAENNLPESLVYIQITRGAGPRTVRSYEGLVPNTLVVVYPTTTFDEAADMPSKTLALVPDIRWHMCDTKTIMLMPNIAAGNQATALGADDALMHRNKIVTEGTAANAFAIKNGELFTHPADNHILHGITRATVIRLARENGFTVNETALTTEQFLDADEVFLSGTTTHVTAVTKIDGQNVGAYTENCALADVYPIAQKLHEFFVSRIGSLIGSPQTA